MLSAIKKLFLNEINDDESDINGHLTHKIAIVLMIEVALSDNNFDQAERDQLVSTVTKKWNLNPAIVLDLIKAAEQQQDSSTSLFEHTRVINKSFSHKDKLELVDCLWEIGFADGNVDHFEEYTIRKIAGLIYIEHQDFIKSKIRVRDRA